MATLVSDLINNALAEIGVYAPGESTQAADQTFAFSKLNRIIDQWAARKLFAYNVNFQQFNLAPNLNPHTIGPAGSPSPTFLITGTRPVRIESAALVLTNVTPNVDLPLKMRDDDWWANQRVKALASSIPTDLYYSPDFPLGKCNFWPVPNAAYAVRLEIWQVLAQFATVNDAVALPPGYEEALTLTLAEGLAPTMTPTGMPTQMTMQNAARARATIQKNNDASPRIGADMGNRAGGFNYYSGQ